MTLIIWCLPLDKASSCNAGRPFFSKFIGDIFWILGFACMVVLAMLEFWGALGATTVMFNPG